MVMIITFNCPVIPATYEVYPVAHSLCVSQYQRTIVGMVSLESATNYIPESLETSDKLSEPSPS